MKRTEVRASSFLSALQISCQKPPLIKEAPKSECQTFQRTAAMSLRTPPSAAIGLDSAARSVRKDVHPSSRTLSEVNVTSPLRERATKLFDANQRHTWLSGATLTRPWSKRPR